MVKLHVLVGDVHHEVEVERREGALAVTVAGETHRIDVATLADGEAYSLLIDDRSVDVGIEEDGTALQLLIAGRRYATEVLGERDWMARSIQPESAGGEKVVRAVMTGIVREVFVGPGDAVSAGQVVFILEAMKMENEVKVDADGVVSRVTVEAGATVDQGDVVIEIE